MSSLSVQQYHPFSIFKLRDPWILFALSLLIRLAYNLSQSGTTLFACDGFEYLTDAQALSAFFHNSAGIQSLRDLSIAGPVFPLFIACSYLLFGQAPAVDHAMPLLVTQSLISALTVVFIAQIAQACWNRRAGLVAGLIAALYPAFIINSGRAYSETFAAFLLSGLLLLVCKIITTQSDKPQANLLACLIAGLTAAALQLTRSSMAAISALSILFIAAFLFRKKAYAQVLKAIIVFVMGFLAAAIPWLCFSHMAFGSASLILNRAGHYNFFIGNNIDSLGWLPVPSPDLAGIDRANLLQIFRCATHKNLWLWCNLLLDKAHRLFDFPWNDFRINLGAVSYYPQVLIHQALLLLAAVGIGLCLFTRYSGEDTVDHSRQLTCRLFAFAVLCLHLPYMLFITVPRYNLTAMPVIIVFAAAGIVEFFQLLSNKDKRKHGVYLVSAVIVLFLIAHFSLQFFSQLVGLSNAPLLAAILLSIIKAAICITFFYRLWFIAVSELAHSTALGGRLATITVALLAIIITAVLALPARANGRLFEWQRILQSPADIFTATIRLPAALQSPCYLLIDSNGLQQIQHDAVVRINGRRLTGPFIPGLSLMGNLSSFTAFDLHQLYLECGYIFNCLTSPSNISNVDLRQWFFVPLSKDVVEGASKLGYMRIEIMPSDKHPVQVFSQRAVGHHILMPSFDKCSWEKAFYGVESATDFNDPRYDFELNTKDRDGTLIPDVLLLTGKQGNNGIASPICMPATVHKDSTGLSICSHSVPNYDEHTFWIIRMSGNIKLPVINQRATHGSLKVAASVVSKVFPSQQYRSIPLHMISTEWDHQGRAYGSIKSPQTFTYTPPWMPHHITVSAASFDIAFPLIPSAMPGKLKSVKLSLSSTDNTPLELSDYKIEVYNNLRPSNSAPDFLVPEDFEIR